MERPPKKYVCEKCGYLGDTSEHEGCDYLAWTTGEQLYIDQLERELALLKASPASVPEGFTMSEPEILPDGSGFGTMTEREATLLGKVERQSAALKLAREALVIQPKRFITKWKDGIDIEVLDRKTELANQAIAAINEVLKGE